MAKPTLIKNAVIVSMNKKREVFKGDLLIQNNFITKVAKNIKAKNEKVIDATDCFLIPGLVQAHTHLCQVLARGEADDMQLLDWLNKSIWPFESNHNRKSIQASARLGLLEMQKAGTTTILDMATVKHTEDMFEAVCETGIRYYGGKCMMDRKGYCGPLLEETSASLIETEDLINRWHQKSNLFNYVLSPRFAVSCTDELLQACRFLQKKHNLLVHTHASENEDEIALVKKLSGFDNIEYFHDLDLLNEKTVLVHLVHLSENEKKLIQLTNTKAVHCPSSNMKLASGFSPVKEYLEDGICVGLGSDGAPCNNSMDPFIEMRMAALIHKPRYGSEAMSAEKVFEMATLNGAKLLGREKDLGSIEVGKLADFVLVDRSHPSVCTVENPYSALVYSCLGRDVKHVFINGKQIVRNFKHTLLDEEEVKYQAIKEKKALLRRAL